jgi:hypothetical protein
MNRTRSEYRAARATELARAGLTYDAIARQLGYADPSGAWRAVRRCLKHRQQAAADEYINGGLVDLQILVDKHWRKAVLGDLRAAEVVLTALERQRRLLEMQSKQESQMAEPVKPVRKRRAAREPDGGVFVSMIV